MIKDTVRYGDIKKDYIFDGQNITLNFEQDLKSIKQLLKNNHEKRGEKQKGDMWHVASIPMEVVVDLYNKGLKIGDKNDWPQIRKLLNTDYRYLKTIDGEI